MNCLLSRGRQFLNLIFLILRVYVNIQWMSLVFVVEVVGNTYVPNRKIYILRIETPFLLVFSQYIIINALTFMPIVFCLI